MFEPAILIKQNKKNLQQIWSLEKFENRLVDMREIYEEFKSKEVMAKLQTFFHYKNFYL